MASASSQQEDPGTHQEEAGQGTGGKDSVVERRRQGSLLELQGKIGVLLIE